MARPIDYSKWDDIDTDSDDDTDRSNVKQSARTQATTITTTPKTAQETNTTFSTPSPVTSHTPLTSPIEGLVLCSRGARQGLQRIKLAPTDPFFSSQHTHHCPVPALLGVPLLIHRHMKENPCSIPRSAAHDNQFATWLMIDPQTGFAPPEWQMNVGTVTLARKDGVGFTTNDLNCLTDYISNLLDKYSDGNVRRERDLVPATYERFRKTY